jgi:hypothetical protein
VWESEVQWTNPIPALLISVHNQHTVRMPSTELCKGLQAVRRTKATGLITESPQTSV